MQERRSTREEEPRLRPSLQGLLVGGGQVPHQDLPRGRLRPGQICSQPPDNPNTSITNMAEYLAAEDMGDHQLPTPIFWIEHYPEHEGEIREYSLVGYVGGLSRRNLAPSGGISPMVAA